MSLTIIATPAASDANSYVTEAQAAAYFIARLESAYYKETDSERKKAALIQSTQKLDMLPFIGSKLNSWPEGHAQYQILQWPRIGAGDIGWFTTDGGDGLPYSYDSTGNLIIPKIIRDACCEQAEYLLSNNYIESNERILLQRQGVRSFSVPGLSENYTDGSASGFNSQYSPSALALIRKFCVWNDNRVGRG